MQIVLIASAESGQAGFPPEMIEGIQAPRRFYPIVGGILTLSGQLEPVLHHDAEELLKNAIYRLPTPMEQEAMTQAAVQASMVQESGSEQEDSPPALESDDPPPDSPFAKKNKKASGG